jgi:Na+-transporting methylmalonyl-CoA/oxaloacetate decarboxylase gamma subunit
LKYQNLRGMENYITLRNIIILFFLILISACQRNSQDLQTISSEDKNYNEVKEVQKIVDEESGKVIYVIR